MRDLISDATFGPVTHFFNELLVLTANKIRTLERAQSQFQFEILDNLDIDVTSYDADLRYEYVNRNSIKNHDVREWIIGKNDYEYCEYRNKPKEIAVQRTKFLNLVKQTKTLLEFEEELLGPDNEKIYFVRRICPILDENNDVKRIIGYGINITDRRLAQRTLEVSEQRYRSIYQTIGVAIFEYDITKLRARFEQLRQDGIVDLRKYVDQDINRLTELRLLVDVVDCNNHAINQYEASSKEQILTSFHETLVPEVNDTLFDWINTMFKNETLHQVQTINQTFNHKKIHTLAQTSFPTKESGVNRVISSISDLTKLRETEIALRESELKYRTIFDSVGVGIIEFDPIDLQNRFDELKNTGVTDLESYFETNSEYLSDLIQLVKVKDCNDQLIRQYKADSKNQILNSFGNAHISDGERELRLWFIAIFESKQFVTGGDNAPNISRQLDPHIRKL